MLAGLLIAGLWQSAEAMTALPDEAAALALQCLKRRERPPEFPALALERKLNMHGLLRAKLRFERPDRAPKVEVLANTANEQMQDEVLDYLGSYRLPCMKQGQAPIIAVQEFIFDNLASPEGKPLRLTEEDTKAAACVVMPRQAPVPPRNTLDRSQTQVMIEARFVGTGAQPPEVTIVFTDASSAVQRMVLDYLAEYRMPCRADGDKPYAFQQHFTFTPDGEPRVVFKEAQMPLRRFLPYIKGIENEQVYFDFGSMSCPFQVDWTFTQPVRLNDVRQLGQRDLNRTEFSAWLAGLQLAVPERLGRQLLGSSIVIDIPCGVLDFRKRAPQSETRQ